MDFQNAMPVSVPACAAARGNTSRSGGCGRPAHCGGANRSNDGRCGLVMKAVAAVSFMICAVLALYGYKLGLFTSVDSLRQFIAGFGRGGALAFIAFQAVQVVVPILPGGLGCLGGVLMFGAWKGFLYNYLGICTGSLAAFQIAKHFGRPVLTSLFSEELIKRYDIWTSAEGNFAKWFALAIFLPVAPDDYLCYLAGTTEMTTKLFMTIILLGKPFAIAMYSLGLTLVFDRLAAIF